METHELLETELLSDYEQERGKQMPNEQHSITQTNLIVAFSNRYKDRYRTMSELSIQLGSRVAVPDICLYSRYDINWLKESPAIKSEPPLLVVEIVSPSQTLAQIRDKTLEYFAAGVLSCWIVQPELQTVSVLHPNTKARTFDSGLIEDSALNITLPVADVFE